jgi:pimeloyl-ACP methyl ester carboxylesterase
MKYFPYPIVLLVFLLVGCAGSKPAQITTMTDIQYPLPVKYVDLQEGIRIGYMDEGKGTNTLVMIHGLGSYSPAWIKNIQDLKSDYRCIALDLPGYGHSSKGDYPGDLTFYTGIIHQFIEALNLESVTLAGHSMGGQIAIITALAHPEQIGGLVLVAPAGFEQFHKGQKQWFREVFTPDIVRLTPVEAIRNNYATNFYKFPEDANFMIRDRIAMRDADDFNWYCDIIPKNVRGMVDNPVYQLLPEIKQPVLTIFGSQDNLIPNRYLNGGSTTTIAVDGSRRIPNSLLVMIDQAGHFVQFEKSEEVNQAIRDFINGR